MSLESHKFEWLFNEIAETGYHILSRTLVREGRYPNPFPEYPSINMQSIREGDRITIRAFFAVETSEFPRIDGGEMDLEVECIEDATTLFAVICTELPTHFALAKGTTLELDIDEVLRVWR